MVSWEDDELKMRVDASTSSIPVIDFTNWKGDSTVEAKHKIGKELADVCHNVGFVYIVNHGISTELLKDAFVWSKRLFYLNLEEKMLAPHPDGAAVHRGYSYPGLEKVSQVISDVEIGEKLREVKDCKVRPNRDHESTVLRKDRKAMKLEVRRTRSSQMFGYQKKSYLDTKNL